MQKHKVYYITPNDEKEPMAIIVPKEYFTNNVFQKVFKLLERNNCKIEELKEKEVVTTIKERHPLTGEFVRAAGLNCTGIYARIGYGKIQFILGHG